MAVATAGAAASLADQRLLKLHCVRVFVLDEADDLMQQEGGAAVLRLFRALDQRAGGAARLQVAMFSATLHSRRVQQLAAQVCLDATWADLKGAANNRISENSENAERSTLRGGAAYGE